MYTLRSVFIRKTNLVAPCLFSYLYVILINNNFHCDIGQILTDPEGNLVIIELILDTKNITLISIYGPNDDKPNFYRNIKQKVLDFGNENVIFVVTEI